VSTFVWLIATSTEIYVVAHTRRTIVATIFIGKTCCSGRTRSLSLIEHALNSRSQRVRERLGQATMQRQWSIIGTLIWLGACCQVVHSVAAPKYDPQLQSTTLNEVYLRAGKWAQALDADPLRIENDLRMKGVKHYVEYISLLHEMQPTANATVLAWSQEALKAAHKITTTSAYHDNVMNGAIVHKTKPLKFRADSISYLRACMVFKNAGFDTTYYEKRIDQLKPILDEHIPTRGVMQRLAFGLLYDELGLQAGPSMKASYEDEMRRAWRSTSIAMRRPLEWYIEPNITPSRIYQITHEVFETTNTGDHPFTLGEEDRLYGLKVLVELMDHKHEQMNSRRERSLDTDHLCELVMSYACFADTRGDLQEPYRSQPDASLVLPDDHVDALVRAMANILPRQKPEGPFGLLFTKHFEDLNKKYHKNPNHDAQIGAALHCTSVCLRACSLIFRFPQVQARVFASEAPPALPSLLSKREPRKQSVSSDGHAYGNRRDSAGFLSALSRSATPTGTVYTRRGRSDEDLSPSENLNDPTRSEDVVRQIKYVMEAHGSGFRRELLEDIRLTLLDFSDEVVV